jgi:basic membrane protein A
MNSPAVPSVAQRNGAGVIGYGWNQEARSPKAWLSSFIFNWGPYYLQQAEAVANGTWKPSVYYGGLAQDAITMSPFGPSVPQSVIDLVNQKKAEIKSGSLDVLAGPIVDNQGKTVVAKGSTIPTADRPTCCDWYAAGVEGTVPKS